MFFPSNRRLTMYIRCPINGKLRRLAVIQKIKLMKIIGVNGKQNLLVLRLLPFSH